MYSVSGNGLGTPLPVDGKCPSGYQYVPSQPIPGTRGMTQPSCRSENWASTLLSPATVHALAKPSTTPKLVDGKVTCPEGYYAYAPIGSNASCIPSGMSTPAMMKCPTGTQHVCREVTDGIRCECEAVEVIPMSQELPEAIDEKIPEELKEKKKSIPLWGWGLIFGGGGLVVGGAITGIIVAVRR